MNDILTRLPGDREPNPADEERARVMLETAALGPLERTPALTRHDLNHLLRRADPDTPFSRQ